MRPRLRTTLTTVLGALALGIPACGGSSANDAPRPLGDAKSAKVIFLHHSTGLNIWKGGIPEGVAQYNGAKGTTHEIEERSFPAAEPYGWNNYPYDYWNIWVNHAGPKPYEDQATLEILSKRYDVIVWKHCYPVSQVLPDDGPVDVASDKRRLGNYKAQYEALKAKMLQFKDTKFVVWTGAVETSEGINQTQAETTKAFFDWVKTTWDTPGDNIFVWDLYSVETDGGLYLKPDFAVAPKDAHPNATLTRLAAPLFVNRLTAILEGRGDTTSLTGK